MTYEHECRTGVRVDHLQQALQAASSDGWELVTARWFPSEGWTLFFKRLKDLGIDYKSIEQRIFDGLNKHTNAASPTRVAEMYSGPPTTPPPSDSRSVPAWLCGLIDAMEAAAMRAVDFVALSNSTGRFAEAREYVGDASAEAFKTAQEEVGFKKGEGS